ncbi:MAG: polysulfide reductase NrfD [SAR324 cluster bacterium]|nr:polysulfide reductase NrfD [SAR324 cluster bacterium]
MIEKGLTGSKTYMTWLGLLGSLMAVGAYGYKQQLDYGLGITGMGRDISWGIYVAQFTFMVGVAASAVMLVLPYYLHNFKAFAKIVVLGEFLAVSAVVMCILFIFVDLGKPSRILNVMLYPTPHSMLFWDMLVLNGYLILNTLCGRVVLKAERQQVPPPKWIKPFILLSIPWAFSIHTVTAFLFAGLPGRHLWLTAILAPRFLASAFAAGPALLILLALLVKRIADFDAGKAAFDKLITIVTYGSIANFFFIGLEFFTAYYSNIPSHMHSLEYLYFGLDGKTALVPFMWTSTFLGLGAIGLFLYPKTRDNETLLAIACAGIFISLWIDKGIGLIIGGFVPNAFEEVIEYQVTGVEISIVVGIWATGIFVLSVLFKSAIDIKKIHE